MNNLPTIVPKSIRPTIPKPRTTVKARNRDQVETGEHGKKEERIEDTVEQNFDDDDNENEVAMLKKEMDSLKKKHQQEVEVLTEGMKHIQLERDTLKERLQKTALSVDALKNNAEMFHFFTGFPDYETFKIVFDSLGPAATKIVYYKSNTNIDKQSEQAEKRGPKRNLSPEQEFFLVIVRLRCGSLGKDIAHRAGISVSYYSTIFISWVDFLHSRLRSLPIWASRKTINDTMPDAFKEMYPSTRVILDATEIFIEMPSSLRSQSETYSNYKHHNTAKGLIGIAPSGAVTFVSDLYAGRCSDKAITKDSGILEMLEENDSVMADKGFTIEEDLPPATYLNIPPFLRDHASLTLEEEVATRQIASVRVHVERAIRRIKTFRILKTIFPISMSADLNKIWIICAYLTNFLPPLIAVK